MTTAKENLDAKIGAMVANSMPSRTIARRLFLYDFNYVFSDDEERGFRILNAVCDQFKLAFSTVKVVGSAQLGYSYFSHNDFVPGESDLDIAIISPTLFQEYSELIFSATTWYRDLSKFPRRDGVSVAQDFRNYLSSGFFRPDLMPNLPLKTNWFGFFNRLSNDHADMFKNINAAIYLSECFFETKNASIVSAYRKDQR